MNWLNVTMSPLLNKIISSGIVLLIVFALRMIVVRGLVKREGLTPTIRRRWMIATRNGAFFLVLAGLVFVWFEQLRTLAATAVVVAAAIVIATKELVKADSDWQQAEEALLKAANEVCTRYIDEARKHMRHLSTRHSLDAPRVEPKVHIQIPQPEVINLVLRVPIPARRRGRTEQSILRRYLLNLKNLSPSDNVVKDGA